MSALARGNDAALVELPREIWSQGSRPMQGRLLRWTSTGLIISFGFVFANLPIRLGGIAIGAAVFFGLFPIIDSRLEALGKQLAAAKRGEAGKLIAGLEKRWIVSRFAPNVWVSAQKARLNMIKGDTRAAAASFAEAVRHSGDPHQPHLTGSQAHALGLSGDPKGARQLLVGMEERDQLRPLDELNLGVAYVEEHGKADRAIELLESAREALGPSPRTDSALALAFARGGKTDDAAALLDALDEDSFDDDVAKALHKRARRSVRQAAETKPGKPKRKSTKTTDPEKTGKAKGKAKRDRRKERREKRKARGKGKKGRKDPSVDLSAAEEAKAAKAAEEAKAAKAAEEAKAAKAKADADAKAKAAAEAAKARAEAEARAAEEATARAVAQKEADEREARAKAVAEVLARSAEEDTEAEAKAKAQADQAAEAAAKRALEKARAKAKAKAEEKPRAEKPLFGSESEPLFVPPPVPAFGTTSNGASAKPTVPKPPKVAAPKVAPPPVTGDGGDKKPAIDTDGWDDLFGDD